MASRRNSVFVPVYNSSNRKVDDVQLFFMAHVIYALDIVQIRCTLTLRLLDVFFPGSYTLRLRLKSEKMDFQSHHLGVTIGSGGLWC